MRESVCSVHRSYSKALNRLNVSVREPVILLLKYENHEVVLETDDATGCLFSFQLLNLSSLSFNVLMDTFWTGNCLPDRLFNLVFVSTCLECVVGVMAVSSHRNYKWLRGCSWHDLAMVHENHHMRRALKKGKPYEFKVMFLSC